MSKLLEFQKETINNLPKSKGRRQVSNFFILHSKYHIPTDDLKLFINQEQPRHYVAMLLTLMYCFNVSLQQLTTIKKNGKLFMVHAVYEVGSTILFGIELCSGELLKLNVHFKNCSGLLALNINQ